MSVHFRFPRQLLAACGVLFSSAVLAHPGHDHTVGFVAGFAHPLSGMDHLLAMIAVGLWAAQMGGRALWALPAAFVSVLLAGAAVAMLDVPVDGIEQAIAVSVIVLGALVAMRARLWTAAGAVLVSAFAFFHGYAHGLEIPATAGAAGYMAGFALATAALHGAGIALGMSMERGLAAQATRWAGAAVAVGGIALLF